MTTAYEVEAIIIGIYPVVNIDPVRMYKPRLDNTQAVVSTVDQSEVLDDYALATIEEEMVGPLCIFQSARRRHVGPR